MIYDYIVFYQERIKNEFNYYIPAMEGSQVLMLIKGGSSSSEGNRRARPSQAKRYDCKFLL